ncbi:virulence RhuM family protein, partial [Patescibacteria group bacterium]
MKKKKEQFNKGEIVIYKTSKNEVELKVRFENENIWLDARQMAKILDVNRPAIVKHIQNIYKNGELEANLTCSILEQVATDGKIRKINLYNLDMIISVGYRVNSQRATEFRIWATKILKQHLLKGYTINKKRITQNYDRFLQAVAKVKSLLPKGDEVRAKDVLELMNAFATTWFSLEAYDTDNFPKKGASKKRVLFTAEELKNALQNFKQELIAKKQTTELFGQERQREATAGIVGN